MIELVLPSKPNPRALNIAASNVFLQPIFFGGEGSEKNI